MSGSLNGNTCINNKLLARQSFFNVMILWNEAEYINYKLSNIQLNLPVRYAASLVVYLDQFLLCAALARLQLSSFLLQFSLRFRFRF